MNLYDAIKQRNVEEIFDLLKKGADANGQDVTDAKGVLLFRRPPLYDLITQKPQVDSFQEHIPSLITAFIDKDADPIYRTTRRTISFLEMALSTSYWSIVPALLNKDNVNERDQNGKSMLILSLTQATLPPTTLIQLFIKLGVDINQENRAEFTALHYAVKSVEIITLLLNNFPNIDINDLSVFGMTPLECAGVEGCWDTFQLLLDRGANPCLLFRSNEDVYTILDRMLPPPPIMAQIIERQKKNCFLFNPGKSVVLQLNYFDRPITNATQKWVEEYYNSIAGMLAFASVDQERLGYSSAMNRFPFELRREVYRMLQRNVWPNRFNN